MESNLERQYYKNNRMDGYDQLLCEIKQAHDSARLNEVVQKNTWVRRISRRISEDALESLRNKDNSPT